MEKTFKKNFSRIIAFVESGLSVRNKQERKRQFFFAIALGCFVLFTVSYSAKQKLLANYRELESVRIEDRNEAIITISPNKRGFYAQYSNDLPLRIKELLVKKEDRFFYWHPGINPFSILRALPQYATNSGRGASTITQQLVKNLLGNEQSRSLTNKIIEAWYAVCLELFTSKDAILTMYANTVYMGNRIQGLSGASELYFDKKLEQLNDTEIAMLLATLSGPSLQNPWDDKKYTAAKNIAKRIGVIFEPAVATIARKHLYIPPQDFELAAMGIQCETTCKTTLDADIKNRLRTLLNRHVESGWDAGARSGAIVVIKLPENEVLATIGTPNVASLESGQQINMSTKPRPIGSTIKPFIYLQGFTGGLRPYTLVNDREYKFPIGTGFPLYPKNYDGSFRGWVTLHSALSNSLNIPTVRVLQHIGLNNFYDFLENALGFTPLQDLDTYKYGIALGALEVDPLTLAHYLTIFPQNGVLKPLQLFLDGSNAKTIKSPMSNVKSAQKVADARFTALVSKVLNDRLSGVQQFGLSSSLNLSQSNYAVKTGTSQDYHDSWTVGYTPDFLVAVWFGNPDNTPLKHVTGQSGAGGVWHDTMELLINSPYNKKTPFDFSQIQNVPIGGNIDFGLFGEKTSAHRNLLPDNTVIITPQNGDRFLYETRMGIPLISPEKVTWYANEELLGTGDKVFFSPPHEGDYVIKALNEVGDATRVLIHITAQR